MTREHTRSLVYGWGVNDSDYVTQKIEYYFDNITGKRRSRKLWTCPYYQKWASMIMRCYSKKRLKLTPTYKDVMVCMDWKYFSVFRTWMQTQDWEGKVLDKDILGDGKLYSPDTCCFITQRVNMFIVKQTADRELPTGVLKANNKFMAKAKHISGDYYYLGCFSSAEEAHEKWKAFKRGVLFEMRGEVGNDLVFEKLMERYS